VIAGLSTQGKEPAIGPGHVGLGRLRDYYRAGVRRVRRT
jgi:hypothetical protein